MQFSAKMEREREKEKNMPLYLNGAAAANIANDADVVDDTEANVLEHCYCCLL